MAVKEVMYLDLKRFLLLKVLEPDSSGKRFCSIGKKTHNDNNTSNNDKQRSNSNTKTYNNISIVTGEITYIN